jgi:hypothetical protein
MNSGRLRFFIICASSFVVNPQNALPGMNNVNSRGPLLHLFRESAQSEWKYISLRDIINAVFRREESTMEKKSDNKLLRIFAVIGIVAAVAAIAYAIYKFFTPDYLEDFEDDFDDDFDDYFEDEDEDDKTAEAKDTVKEKAEKVRDKVVDVTEDVKEKVNGVVDDVKEKVSDK